MGPGPHDAPATPQRQLLVPFAGRPPGTAASGRAPGARGRRHRRRWLHRPLDGLLPEPPPAGPRDRGVRSRDRRLRRERTQRRLVHGHGRRDRGTPARSGAGRGARAAARDAGDRRRDRAGLPGGEHRLPLRQGRHPHRRDHGAPRGGVPRVRGGQARPRLHRRRLHLARTGGVRPTHRRPPELRRLVHQPLRGDPPRTAGSRPRRYRTPQGDHGLRAHPGARHRAGSRRDPAGQRPRRHRAAGDRGLHRHHLRPPAPPGPGVHHDGRHGAPVRRCLERTWARPSRDVRGRPAHRDLRPEDARR